MAAATLRRQASRTATYCTLMLLVLVCSLATSISADTELATYSTIDADKDESISTLISLPTAGVNAPNDERSRKYQLNVDEALELLRARSSIPASQVSTESLSLNPSSPKFSRLFGFIGKFFLLSSVESEEVYAEHSSSSRPPESQSTETVLDFSTTQSAAAESTPEIDLSSTIKSQGSHSDPLLTLEDAAAHGNADAMYLLAEMNFYGNFTTTKNYTRATIYYKQLSDATGNATAQSMLGFIYATGMFDDIPRDQARALMYHTFAAYGGDTRSEMTLAFRYHSGIGTLRNCEKAVFFYKRVADKAMKYWRNGPAGGRTLDRHTWKLADDNGGLFGEGASESSSGPNSKKRYSPASDSASLDDVLEYLRYKAEKSDIAAQYSLARLYYDGTRSLPRNYKKALRYFKVIARQYWSNDATPISGAPKSPTNYGVKAAGYLGRMYLRGEGTPIDHAKALQWYRLGMEQNDAASLNGFGYMHLKGLGLPKNTAKAAEYFRTAAELDFGPAQVNIGKLFLEQGDVTVAIHYFDLAARHGHIEAYYYLAETHHQALGRERSCGMATVYYKIVAEKVEELQCPLAWAHCLYEQGDYENALIGFMMAAEQGYESGQANVAYLLDQDKSAIDLAKPFKKLIDFVYEVSQEELQEEARMERLDKFLDEVALIYWTRASKQSNVDATVKMGDYYLKGIGCEHDNEKAAACYQVAAEYQQSALALWNLGWMHENGLGVEQDFHLAKRFYDLALTTNIEAYLPVTLSLYKLRLRAFWNSITGGSVNGIRVDEGDIKAVESKKWSFTESWKRWFESLENDDYDNYDRNGDADGADVVDEDEPDEGGGNYQL
ncbi:hypothetical protein V1512DRAFT_255858 [Lipomyces arxii]|uniref:uncharacterized protein n=1 Tax=Lipomyces arxii TaxID=56418 RepID=UPI0034CD104C